jgi:Protein of unknown function (DUF1203)
MSFIIHGLDPALFGSVSHQKQATFNGVPVERHRVTENPGFPCRITLEDAKVGETVLLLSYNHNSAAVPYTQAGPIFVTEGKDKPSSFINEIPPALERRILSLRAYDELGAMIDAALVDGSLAKAQIERMFDNVAVARIDAHNAVRGCFAAHIFRHEV